MLIEEVLRKGIFFFRKKSKTVGGLGSRVLNFLVQIHAMFIWYIIPF